MAYRRVGSLAFCLPPGRPNVGRDDLEVADRAFDGMPILADALQDASCDDDILAHCREPREHVRGCWVVDLLLGER